MLKINNLLSGKLKPENASAGLILFKNKILLQKRDNKSDIFFPDFWGLFGGAKEKNETYVKCLIRELNEEIGLNFQKDRLQFLCKHNLDFKPIKQKNVFRYYFIVNLNKRDYHKIELKEGQKFKLFKLNELMYSKIKIVPYDFFTIWLYKFKQKKK